MSELRKFRRSMRLAQTGMPRRRRKFGPLPRHLPGKGLGGSRQGECKRGRMDDGPGFEVLPDMSPMSDMVSRLLFGQGPGG